MEHSEMRGRVAAFLGIPDFAALIRPTVTAQSSDFAFALSGDACLAQRNPRAA